MNNVLIKTKIHNRFDIHVEHADGTVDKYVQYNTVLDQLYSKKLNKSGGPTAWANNIVFGSGTGEMDSSRTTLFSPIGHKSSSIVSYKVNSDYRSGECKYSITLQPNEYVGKTLTEIGIGTTTEAYTHSLIKDSLGKPIAITKTDTDKIIIYATVYAELFDEEDSGVIWLSDAVFVQIAFGNKSAESYTMYPSSIDAAYSGWIVPSTSYGTTGATFKPETGRITQTYTMDSSSYLNGTDIRSLTVGTYTGYPSTYRYNGYWIPLLGPNFNGVDYQNQRIGMGNGVDTVFKIPTDFRGITDCIVKVDNKVVEVKKNRIHGNNKFVGNSGSIGVKVADNKYARIASVSGSSSSYYGYGIALYEIYENGKVDRKYITKKIGNAETTSGSSYRDSSIFPELNAIAIKATNGDYELHDVDWETGKTTYIGNMPSGTNSEYSTAYAISGTPYIAIQSTYNNSKYYRTLYRYENKQLTKVKDLAYIGARFTGPQSFNKTLKGDYYVNDKLYVFDTSELEFKVKETLPFTTSSRGIIIAPFTIAEIGEHPSGTNYQQLTIKKCNSSWQVTETLVFPDKFPKTTKSGYSLYYLKENVMSISSQEPHIVTFNPDTNEILYRKHKSSLVDYYSQDSGVGYKSTMDVPNSQDFMFQYYSSIVCTQQEVATIEFTQPVPEGDVITIDFTLDYIPKNDSLIATVTNSFSWG